MAFLSLMGKFVAMLLAMEIHPAIALDFPIQKLLKNLKQESLRKMRLTLEIELKKSSNLKLLNLTLASQKLEEMVNLEAPTLPN